MQIQIAHLLATLAIVSTGFAYTCFKYSNTPGYCDYGGPWPAPYSKYRIYECDSSNACPENGHECGVDNPGAYPFADCSHWGQDRA
ncbi:hypothetical protein TI39_contig4504g00001 [Zymoseptoria brevis]|uniref:Uncharacterized protein n=1 Tax=Zymoseptoria brevis TaxID=1047168 RepID=A0A0F4G6H5_9PEZI|nr:hypothetical protein TI39_contig4504g00001 [Zymoseptoria brevis]